MRRKKVIAAGLVSVCLCMTLLAGCKQETVQTETPEPTQQSGTKTEDVSDQLVERGESDVIWTISDDVQVNEDYLNMLNRQLKKDGYDFSLKFQYLQEENYNSQIQTVLANGDTDIALGGQNTDENGNAVETLARAGLLEPLDSALESDAGAALAEEYEEALWGSVKIDGHIYTIPNSIYEDGRYCVVFNNAYIDQEKSKKFSGDLSTLQQYITSEMKASPEGKELLSTWNSEDLASVLGYYEKYGAFFDGETGEVALPYACTKVKDFFDMLYQMNQEKCVSSYVSFVNTDDMSARDEKIKNKEFGILLTKESDTTRSLGDDVTVISLDFVPNFARVGGTNGICAKSEKKEQALQLLSLLHTDDTYAHLLLYGKEGKNYTIQDHVAVPETDSDGTDVSLVDILGIYRSSYPDGEDRIYTTDIRKQKREIYRSKHCHTSVLAGFQIAQDKITASQEKAAASVEKYMDVWKESDYTSEYDALVSKLTKETKKLYQNLETQRDEWKKTAGQTGENAD